MGAGTLPEGKKNREKRGGQFQVERCHGRRDEASKAMVMEQGLAGIRQHQHPSGSGSLHRQGRDNDFFFQQ